MDDLETRNERIKELHASGLTNKELGEMFSLSPSYISNIAHADKRTGSPFGPYVGALTPMKRAYYAKKQLRLNGLI